MLLFMSGSLFDKTGTRKYLVARERLAFAHVAGMRGGIVGLFCLTLALSGARISEVLALTPAQIDEQNGTIVFETLKRRKKQVFRAVPVPRQLVNSILSLQLPRSTRIYPWGRTTAWKIVKCAMKDAGIADNLCQPKALRHGFAVDAGQKQVPLNIVQRWLGHARIETTAIYSEAIGREERNLARRTWTGLLKIRK
jgi:integrase/recombinase XerD